MYRDFEICISVPLKNLEILGKCEIWVETGQCPIAFAELKPRQYQSKSIQK